MAILEDMFTAALGVAVTEGTLAVEAAQAIRVGLGALSDPVNGGHVTADQLAEAVDVLLLEASLLDADRLRQRARDLRDELDLAGVADREGQIYLARGLRRVTRADGGSRWILDLDLETGAYLSDLHDKLLSPRRTS